MQKKLLLISVFIISFSFAAKIILADCENLNSTERINCLEQKVKEGTQKVNDLTTEIQLMNNKIYLTTLKIQETEQKIITTQKEIETLGSRIEGLDTSLNYLSKLLLNKIAEGYKQRSVSLFTVLLDSINANDLINRIKYLKTTQQKNQNLLIQVQETKSNFEEQKKLREEKKIELDQLEKQLDSQKNDLNHQKSQKQLVLQDTQNSNTKYQQLLQQALAEHNAIQQAIITGVKVGPVKKGDPIALVGNSGAPYCSTGPHLHFEVRVNNSWVNAENYLSSKTVEDKQNNGNLAIGSGNWDWPLQDPIVVEQRYGYTPWSWRYKYSGGIHTGVDMWSRSGEVIRAPADGTLYTSAQDCSGSTINIKYIEHNNGLVSFYLHVQ